MVKAFDEVGGSRDYLSIPKTEFGPLIKAMGTAYCEEAHRRIIKKLEFDGGLLQPQMGQFTQWTSTNEDLWEM